MRKVTAAILTGFAAALTALADFIYPRELRRNRVIVVEPSAEDCAAFIGKRKRTSCDLDDNEFVGRLSWDGNYYRDAE